MGFHVGSDAGAIRAVTRRLQDGTFFRQDEDVQDLLKETEWRAVEARKQAAEAPLFEDLQAMFRAQAERVAEAIDEGRWRVPESTDALDAEERQDEPDQPPERTLTAEQVFSLATAVQEMQEVTEEHALDLLQAGFEAGAIRLDADTTFDPDDPEVQAAVQTLNEKARGIAETTRDRINTKIRQGISENESVAEIRDRIVSDLETMAEGTEDQRPRARRIASTTTTTAFEKGQQRSFERAGVFGGMWLSQRDVDVRSGHLVADGQTVPMGEPFEVACRAGASAEDLAFPGDPTGSPCNVINCRCTVLPVPDEEAFTQMQDEEPDLSNLPQLNDESDG